MTKEFIDLGLSTLWSNISEDEFYTYNEAVSQFGSNLPTKEQWEELMDKCEWTWTGNGYKVVGPNGNSIVLPATGSCLCNGPVNNVGYFGFYWSSTPYGSGTAWDIHFNSDDVKVENNLRCFGYSVRLVCPN